MATAVARERHRKETIERLGDMRRLVEQEILPRLGWSGPFELEPVPRGHNLVYFLDVADHPPLVLRAGARRWKFRRRIALHRFALRRGLPVPIVRVAVAPILGRPPGGLFFSAEDRAPGVTLTETDDPIGAAAACGEALARLHALRSPPRPVLLPDGHATTASLMRWLSGRIEHRLEVMNRVDAELARQARSWLAAFSPKDYRHAPRLCLSDVGRGNFVGDAGGMTLVDLVGLRMGSVPLELARARYRLFTNRAPEVRAFRAAYDAAVGPEAAGELADLRVFAEVVYLLKHVYRAMAAGRDDMRERLQNLVERDPR